jgi:4'-phosphopantetheinyl transferase
MIALDSDEAHLWYLVPSDVSRELLEIYRGLLTDEEAAREARYVFEHSRIEYRLTRALARTVLARYTGLDPKALRFVNDSHGRPALDPQSDLTFNLSNTEGLIACAVTRGRQIGVDVESIDRPTATLDIAEHFFSKIEIAELRALPREQQLDRFFDYWTLKESYIKARGLGLLIPLDGFSFLLDGQDAVRIEIDPSLGDDAAGWWFTQLSLSPRHKTALGVSIRAGETLRLKVERTVPLLGAPVRKCDVSGKPALGRNSITAEDAETQRTTAVIGDRNRLLL